MNLYHLIYFQTLARYEHYGKAAEELHITQPSLSKDIRKLEEELQVCLFEKHGRGIRLSKQGARYLDYVNEALRELEIGQDALRYELIPKGGYITHVSFLSWFSSRQDSFVKQAMGRSVH